MARVSAVPEGQRNRRKGALSEVRTDDCITYIGRAVQGLQFRSCQAEANSALQGDSGNRAGYYDLAGQTTGFRAETPKRIKPAERKDSERYTAAGMNLSRSIKNEESQFGPVRPLARGV